MQRQQLPHYSVLTKASGEQVLHSQAIGPSVDLYSQYSFRASAPVHNVSAAGYFWVLVHILLIGSNKAATLTHAHTPICTNSMNAAMSASSVIHPY